MAIDNVAEVIKKIEADNAKSYKSIKVKKAVRLECDVGNLMTTDVNCFDMDEFKKDEEAFLKNLARDNNQMLINQVWELPRSTVKDTVIVTLPDPTTILPREKVCPKAKPLTKWQEFAKLKGIKNKKKSRMVYDEKEKKFMPRWGYKRANDDTKEWAIDVKKNDDPNEDPFAKRKYAKKERVAKNDMQRMRNIARGTGKKVMGVGETLMPGKEKSTEELNTAYHHAKVSTASLGKFENKLKDEKVLKGKKRKFNQLVQTGDEERKNQLKILADLQKGGSGVNVSKAVNKQMGRQQATGNGKRGGKGGKRKR